MSEGGFDYNAYRSGLGQNPDKGLLVTFEYRPHKLSNGDFENREYIRIWMSNTDEVVRPVSDQDKIRFADRYQAFLKNEQPPEDGTPISECTFATPADVASCKSERIYSLEQLVEVPDERLTRARLINFKYKCRDWLEARQRHGYVGELREQIESLKAQVESLKERLVDQGEEEPKKRERPPKVKNGDAVRDSE